MSAYPHSNINDDYYADDDRVLLESVGKIMNVWLAQGSHKKRVQSLPAFIQAVEQVAKTHDTDAPFDTAALIEAVDTPWDLYAAISDQFIGDYFGLVYIAAAYFGEVHSNSEWFAFMTTVRTNVNLGFANAQPILEVAE